MSNYDVRILVNGNNCRQYHFENKVFIEAKIGSEYSIEIKNNTFKRIMAICSVDGLNIINGQPATEQDPGYIINNYSSNRYDGFRVSNTEIAQFVFGGKNASYAASKKDGSEKNVGVIGVRIFQERTHPVMYDTPIITNPWQKYNHTIPWETPYITCCDNGPELSVKCSSNTCNDNVRSLNSPFDVGTTWGKAKESKVTEVDFEKGINDFSIDIYYASRQSLLNMGIPLENIKQVNFPESFSTSKYSKPPNGWNR